MFSRNFDIQGEPIMMRTTAELRTAQQLNISPRLQQAIGLLQLSTPELEQQLREALDSNVFLESDDFDEPAWSSVAPSGGVASGTDRERDVDLPAPEPSLREILTGQISTSGLSGRDRILADLII